MIRCLLAALVLICAPCTPANAQSGPRPFPITGYDLREACLAAEAPSSNDLATITSNAILAAQCWSQLDAFFSGVRFQNIRAREAGLQRPVGAACVPDSLDMIALRQVLLDYIDAHPAARLQRAGIVIALAFESTFPCGQ
jgi:hypothetical protein